METNWKRTGNQLKRSGVFFAVFGLWCPCTEDGCPRTFEILRSFPEVRFQLVDELPILSTAGERTYVALWVGSVIKQFTISINGIDFLFVYTNTGLKYTKFSYTLKSNDGYIIEFCTSFTFYFLKIMI